MLVGVRENERGAQVVQELIHREKVVAGVGIINTGVMLASARFYQEARIPVITPGPTGTTHAALGAVAALAAIGAGDLGGRSGRTVSPGAAVTAPTAATTRTAVTT